MAWRDFQETSGPKEDPVLQLRVSWLQRWHHYSQQAGKVLLDTVGLSLVASVFGSRSLLVCICFPKGEPKSVLASDLQNAGMGCDLEKCLQQNQTYTINHTDTKLHHGTISTSIQRPCSFWRASIGYQLSPEHGKCTILVEVELSQQGQEKSCPCASSE